MSTLIEKDISTELWREYDFQGRIYRIEGVKLYYREGGSTHRIVDKNNITHCVPAPGISGCVLRWIGKDGSPDVQF